MAIILEVCHPRCVCENWKGYVVKHNSVVFDYIPFPAKWPYLFVSKTETIMNCYNKNVFFKLLMMLENSMNRLDIAQSMVLNAG